MKKLFVLFLLAFSVPVMADVITDGTGMCGTVRNLIATFTPAQYTCSSGQYLPADATACSSCSAGDICPGGTYSYNASAAQGRNMCSSSVHNLVATFTPAQYTCSAGQYLPADGIACAACPAGSYCAGGTYTYNATADQGLTGTCSGRTQFSAAGASSCSSVTSGYYTTGCNGSGNQCTGQSQCTGTTYCASGVQYNCPTGYTANTAAGKSAVSQCQTSCAAGTYMASGTYTQLEYLQSTDMQYIDLGRPIGTDENITSKFVYINSDAAEWFGASDGTDWRSPKFTFSYPSADPLHFMIYATANNNLRPYYYMASSPCVIGTEYTINWYGTPYKTATMTPDVGWADTVHESYTPSLNAYLFKANYPGFNNASAAGRYMRIYYFNVENMMNLVPARRNSDSVLGMLDLVSGQFFTNAGTGTFTAGPDVGVIGGTCSSTGAGYYAAASTVNYGSTATQTACPAGKYSTAGAASCSNVDAGYFCSGGCKTATPTSSSDCVSGNTCGQCTTDSTTGRPAYSDAGASSCSVCPTVTGALASRATYYDGYWSSGNHSSVTGCIAHFTDADPDATYDTLCYYSATDGAYGGANSLCQSYGAYITACVAGKYNTISSTTEWKNRTDNSAVYYGVDTMKGKVCTDTTAGYYSPEGATTQTQCPAGTYSTGGAAACTACGEGYNSAAGASSCTANTISVRWGDSSGNVYETTTCTFGGALNTPTTEPTAPRGHHFTGWTFN